MDNKESLHIVLTDTETGAEIEMTIADTATQNGVRYLLVYESGFNDEDEAEARILKEIDDSGDDVYYEQVTGDDELETAAALFNDPENGYEIEL